MPALFRIVQDDCPPIPEGASPIVKDFLYHCFQKDVNLRISAKKLLRHPWMVSARKQMGINPANEKKRGKEKEPNAERRPLSNYNYDEAVLKVQEWNEALKCELISLQHRAYTKQCTKHLRGRLRYHRNLPSRHHLVILMTHASLQRQRLHSWSL